MSRTNEAIFIEWHETCKCKCKFGLIFVNVGEYLLPVLFITIGL